VNSTQIRRRGVSVVGLLGSLALAGLLLGVSAEQVSRTRASRKFPAPGRMVDVGDDVRLQIDCRGSGSPAVVLESGLDIYGSLAWSAVHDSIAATTRVCAYSRRGIMWSNAGSSHFDVERAARQLHSALSASGASAPFVMVGHSIGGMYNAVFTSLYPTEVAGLVMVDATHPSQFPEYERATGKSIQPSASMPRMASRLSWTGLVRLIPVGSAPANWPAIVGQAGFAYIPTSVQSYAAEMAAVSATLERARDVSAIADKPLVVLAVADPKDTTELKMMGLSAEQGRRLDAVHRRLATDMATWSTRGRLELVPRSTHYIQMDRPDVVIAAVREVLGHVTAR
jgi:pimeloyl-ACP methyl ester carboxylesterase